MILFEAAQGLRRSTTFVLGPPVSSSVILQTGPDSSVLTRGDIPQGRLLHLEARLLTDLVRAILDNVDVHRQVVAVVAKGNQATQDLHQLAQESTASKSACLQEGGIFGAASPRTPKDPSHIIPEGIFHNRQRQIRHFTTRQRRSRRILVVDLVGMDSSNTLPHSK